MLDAINLLQKEALLALPEKDEFDSVQFLEG